jgi:uncharacterized protein YegP (UPF0339 family)
MLFQPSSLCLRQHLSFLTREGIRLLDPLRAFGSHHLRGGRITSIQHCLIPHAGSWAMPNIRLFEANGAGTHQPCGRFITRRAVVPIKHITTRTAMGFEVYQARGTPEWSWRLVALDAMVVAHGEGFPSLDDCLAAIQLVKGTNHVTPVFNRDTGDLIPEA